MYTLSGSTVSQNRETFRLYGAEEATGKDLRLTIWLIPRYRLDKLIDLMVEKSLTFMTLVDVDL